MPTIVNLTPTVVPLVADLFPNTAIAPFMPSIKQLAAKANKTMQASHLHLVIRVTLIKASAADPVTVSVTLQDSTLSLGDMLLDSGEQRGFFQDMVEVQMAFGGTDFSRTSDGPETVNGSGSTSSSMSASFSASVNGGFFGGTATGGAGLSGSSSISNSFSRNLQDFKVENKSNQKEAHHVYLMSMSSGGAYSKPTDFWQAPNAASLVSSAFGGAPLALSSPPDLATTNLPLLSQCTWQANHARDIDQTLAIQIKISHRAALVQKTGNQIVPLVALVEHRYEHPVPLGQLIDPPSLPVNPLT